MNRVILIGRLTRDPELRYSQSNMALTTITVAVDRYSRQQQENTADFINCVVFDKQAENVCKYLSKGRLVAVEGRIQTRNYDGQDGKKVYVTEVVANNVKFLESRSQVSQATSNQQPNEQVSPYNFQKPSNEAPATLDIAPEVDPFESFGKQTEVSDSDLPF
ncbi:MAG: single-stranded DNA-binding protein [bacterium]|nr:single-stranded DNA-binding protein [bacterium]